MFTSELGSDYADIVVLDDEGTFEDVNVIITDESRVFIRQWDEHNEEYQIICLSYVQLNEIFCALQNPSGAYDTRMKVKV